MISSACATEVGVSDDRKFSPLPSEVLYLSFVGCACQGKTCDARSSDVMAVAAVMAVVAAA